jgi:hypothetical protein
MQQPVELQDMAADVRHQAWGHYGGKRQEDPIANIGVGWCRLILADNGQ